jgi:6-phosphogluconate dehydrogenase
MQLGVIGLGTMGANLARNAARNKAKVTVFNRTTAKTDAFVRAHKNEGDITGASTLEQCVESQRPPRAILLMVKAGDAVDALIAKLLLHLTEGDILIDGGNSHFRQTERRQRELAGRGIHLLGMGVSGGEEGALRGPSLMPGGSEEAYEKIAPLLEAMAASDGDGGKSVTYLGPGGAGHFVKMVHNGIEYGIMQLIAEAYDLLQRGGGLSNAQIADLFEEWNREGNLQSFLTESTVAVLRKKDDATGKDLIDLIQDKAEQKGTGKWTVEAALDLGVAIPTITAAVEARIVSSGKDFRVQQSNKDSLAIDDKASLSDVAESVRTALELSVINTYAQGFQLLAAASDTEKWNLNLSEIARIWRGGCIIRSALLEHFQAMFTGDRKAAETVRARFSAENQRAWRRTVAFGALRALPLPAHAASLQYYDAYRTARLPQHIIQALRDLFGAHGFERTDKQGTFHVDWHGSKL